MNSRQGQRPPARILEWILLTALTLLAASSLGTGARSAVRPDRSQDFQWSGTRMVLERVNPWQNELEGDPNHRIFKQQHANYLPLIYVLLLPFGLMSLDHATAIWMVCNVAFGLLSGVLCARFYRLNWMRGWALVALFAMSTPVRVTIGNGQHGLLVLLCWVLGLCRSPGDESGLTIGLSYAKYNFAPPAFLFVLLRLGYRAALLSLVPALIALLGVYVWLGGSLTHPATLAHFTLEPLIAANRGAYYGGPALDLMDLVDYTLWQAQAPTTLRVLMTYVPAMALLSWAVFWIARRSRAAWEMQIALLAIVTVVLCRHHSYDEVLLLLPAAYCIQNLQQTAARWALAALCYPWFAAKLLDIIGINAMWGALIGTMSLLLMWFLLLRIEPVERTVAPAAAEVRDYFDGAKA